MIAANYQNIKTISKDFESCGKCIHEETGTLGIQEATKASVHKSNQIDD